MQRATRSLGESLDRLASAMLELCDVFENEYKKAGCPFGDTRRGMAIWWQYGQRSTQN
ncbi:MAG: hypothetical protein ACE5G0_07015 [Rhodothermales bacterium]